MKVKPAKSRQEIKALNRIKQTYKNLFRKTGGLAAAFFMVNMLNL